VNWLDAFFRPPSPEWAGTLVGLALGVVSAAAAIYSSVAVPWAASLEAATSATFDQYKKPLLTSGDDGYKAYLRLSEVRKRDPRPGLGKITGAIAIPMTVLGGIAGLQVPNVGWLYTVGPILVAGIVEGFAILALGRVARREADSRLKQMNP
jgi:hypothetical protein